MITEEYARTAPAGPELDRVCAEFMDSIFHTAGMISLDDYHLIEGEGGHPDIFIPRYSTSWSAAGPLLVALGNGMILERRMDGGQWQVLMPFLVQIGEAPTPCLAIARACAVLVARGITREQLRGDL